MAEMTWLVCQGCRRPFRYPAWRWRSHCIECGGDDDLPVGLVLAFAAVVDVIGVLLMLAIWRVL